MAGGQLRLLHALDVARTQFYHFTTIVIAGMGFFTDAYDLFSIPLVIDHIGDFYYCDRLPGRVRAAITSIALCGTVPGALIFGWLGDKMGRKRIYGVTLVLMVACSLASGLSFSGTTRVDCSLDSGLSFSGSTRKDVVTTLCFFRFWLGVGIGGDYPLSATIMSEYANKRRRGTLIAAIFSMQGFGIMAAGIVTMVVSAAIKNVDYVWRVVLMLGSIPAALTYYWRMKMPETARYTTLIAKNTNKAAADMSAILNMHMVPDEEAMNELERQDQYGLFSTEFFHQHGIHLIATSVCWLILDITFYSFNLFMMDDLIKPLIGHIKNPFGQLMAHTAITLCSTVPGYFFTVAFIDRIGRVKIQLLGFAMMSVLTLGLAVPYNRYWRKPENMLGFAAIYAMIFFFTNFGPNTTTFIIPAEIFPARLRSTCHGISGAAGKIGAIIGVFCFLHTKENRQRLLYALVGCNLIGLLFTLLLPESKGKSLEEITGEMVEHQLLDGGAQAVAGTEYVHIVST